MTPASDEELRELRRRAYGRDPDIHLDPDALKRLHELESLQVVVEAPVDVEVAEVVEQPAEPELRDVEPTPRRPPAWVMAFLAWLTGLRRSTVFLAIGALLIAAGLVTALTIVQRVQTDPLQVGATQVARLGVDTGYDVPEVFGGAAAQSDFGIRAFQLFHGLRGIVTSTGVFFTGAPGAPCLTLYPEANVTTTSDSFGGAIFGGCAAGDFPPMVQFSADTEGLPEELKAAFPESTGLQFIYDPEHEEIVVFSDQE